MISEQELHVLWDSIPDEPKPGAPTEAVAAYAEHLAETNPRFAVAWLAAYRYDKYADIERFCGLSEREAVALRAVEMYEEQQGFHNIQKRAAQRGLD